jgi:hypothetical protein
VAKPKDRTASYLEGECDGCGARKGECECHQPEQPPAQEPPVEEEDWRKYL